MKYDLRNIDKLDLSKEFEKLYLKKNLIMEYGKDGIFLYKKMVSEDDPESKVQPNSEIWYTTTNKTIIPNPTSEQWSMEDFGANLLSNTYEGDYGILKFDNDVQFIRSNFWEYDSYGLETVSIPSSVTAIDQTGGFHRCPIKSITFLSQTPPAIREEVFDAMYDDFVIYVPEDSVNTYKNAENWCDYVDRIKTKSGEESEEPEEPTPPGPPNNEIWYTSTDGGLVDMLDFEALGLQYDGPKVIENTYVDGKGIIKFDKPLTDMGAEEDMSAIYGPIVGYSVSKLKTISLPPSIRTLHAFSFDDHPEGLEEIKLPSNLVSIKKNAFCDGELPNLKSLVVPSSLIEIEVGSITAWLTRDNFINNSSIDLSDKIHLYDVEYDSIRYSWYYGRLMCNIVDGKTTLSAAIAKTAQRGNGLYIVVGNNIDTIDCSYYYINESNTPDYMIYGEEIKELSTNFLGRSDEDNYSIGVPFKMVDAYKEAYPTIASRIHSYET